MERYNGRVVVETLYNFTYLTGFAKLNIEIISDTKLQVKDYLVCLLLSGPVYDIEKRFK